MPSIPNFTVADAARPDAAERFAAAPLPTEAEEIWRYSRIDDLDLARFAPAGEPADGAELPARVATFLDAAGPRAGVIVTRDAAVVSAELDDALASKGVTFGKVDATSEVAAPPDVDDVFVAMNGAFARQPLVLDVPAGAVVERPIVVVHWVDTDGVAVFPRTIVRAGEQSQVTVLDYVASPDDARALVVPVTHIEVGAAANVRHLSVQDLGTRVWQLGYTRTSVDRDGFLESTAVALGGDYARLRTDAKVMGQGATSNLLAVYFGTGAQMHDFRTLQDHHAPRTTSDLLFKGAIGGDANSVYTGLIRVRPGARGTNAFQTNRNLVLAEGAHAESVPNLEIEENDVRCSHASAIGPVDPDQRYYLETRGVPTAVAERLIVLGFFDEIIERTPVPPLQPLLRQAVVAKLDRALVDG
jgi:Fe-S cluster assembly protein SufD